MENKICTSLEQSKKLIELGIDINTADMCWRIPKDTLAKPTLIAYPLLDWQKTESNYGSWIPCWSLAALLDILHKKGERFNAPPS